MGHRIKKHLWGTHFKIFLSICPKNCDIGENSLNCLCTLRTLLVNYINVRCMAMCYIVRSKYLDGDFVVASENFESNKVLSINKGR